MSLFEPNNPGPGAYEHSKKSAPGVKFSRSIRATEGQEQTPGPGAYTVSTGKKLKRGYYMAGRHKDTADKENPGPGAYDPLNSSLKKDLGRMNNARRLVYEVSDVPGPGSNQGVTQPTTSERRAQARA